MDDPEFQQNVHKFMHYLKSNKTSADAKKIIGLLHTFTLHLEHYPAPMDYIEIGFIITAAIRNTTVATEFILLFFKTYFDLLPQALQHTLKELLVSCSCPLLKYI